MRNKDGTFDKRSKAGKELEAARKEMESEIEAKYAPNEEKPKKKSFFSTLVKLSILLILGYVAYGFIASENKNKANTTGNSNNSIEKNQPKSEESKEGIGNY